MDELVARQGASTVEAFEVGLAPLASQARWSEGEWDFGNEQRPWNTLQNTNADYRLVSHHLVRLLRRAGRAARAVA
ncbi:hypothetical protein D3C86_2167450 [compost metagenome]